MIARFFSPAPVGQSAIFELPEALAHHATRVLRLKVGEPIVLFDGLGGEYAAVIESIGRGVVVRVEAHQPIERESPLNVTLYQALPTGDKMDWVVQKAVELGVASIVPVAADRSVLKLEGSRADKRVLHWNQVAVAACEQCGRNRVPSVAAITTLPAALAQCSAETRLMLAPGADLVLGRLEMAGSIALFIGPEGGWSEAELRAARAMGVQSLQLGPRVLRTETAGLAALAALAARFGDF